MRRDFREKNKERIGNLERESERENIRLMGSSNPLHMWRGVFIVIYKKYKTPTPGLWVRHTVGKDPSFFHGVT